MAIPHLTDEQIQTWTREQKDRWWLEKVYRGNMPQLTIRSAITGFLLGGILSATNLYIGAKTGWTLGVGLTSVILAFAAFKIISAIGSRDMTILENNASQSVATAAGYMTGPLISGLAAYMMVTNVPLPWHQMLWFNVVLSILGVLVAFPMKRRFINEEQQPFPEGRACGVVLDTLYTSEPGIGIFKAKALAAAAIFAAFLKFISGEGYQTLIQAKLLGLSTVRWMSESLDAWYYHSGANVVPKIMNIPIRSLGLSPTLDLAMFGAGGLMHIRYTINMMVGLVIAWCILGPLAVNNGWVMKKGEVLITEVQAAQAGIEVGKSGVIKREVNGVQADVPVLTKFGRTDILNGWLLWPGVAMLVCASMTAFFAKPQVIITAFAGIFGKKKAGADVLKHIEVPLWISWVGMPIVGAGGVWMAHAWFGVRWDLGALAVILTCVLTLIAAQATALTSITPTGSLSKITQFTFGVMAPNHPATNLMTATLTTEVASNASNLLMDIKPGYMLGGKPRHQAIAHIIGIFSGALASTPLFYALFLHEYKAGDNISDTFLKDDKFSFIAAVQWKGISDFIGTLTGQGGLDKIMHPSALQAMIAGALFGIVFEVIRTIMKGKFPISPLAIGLGMLLPPDSTFWMFLGTLFFWVMGKVFGAHDERADPATQANKSFGHKLWVATQEPICAGLIAGAALTGIGDILVGNFLV